MTSLNPAKHQPMCWWPSFCFPLSKAKIKFVVSPWAQIQAGFVQVLTSYPPKFALPTVGNSHGEPAVGCVWGGRTEHCRCLSASWLNPWVGHPQRLVSGILCHTVSSIYIPLMIQYSRWGKRKKGFLVSWGNWALTPMLTSHVLCSSLALSSSFALWEKSYGES